MVKCSPSLMTLETVFLSYMLDLLVMKYLTSGILTISELSTQKENRSMAQLSICIVKVDLEDQNQVSVNHLRCFSNKVSRVFNKIILHNVIKYA